MAALDFPATPTVGQLFAAGNGVTYKWSGIMWIPVGGASMMSIGDTPPSNPGNGQLWWNSVLGTLMLYYTDPNSSAWVPAIASGSNKLLQEISVETGAVATGTTVVPFDNTIPQQTEGNQFMSLAITPQSATSKLIIEVVWVGSNDLQSNLFACLFQDSAANALAVAVSTVAANGITTIAFRHVMTSGTTSATTFKLRVGGNGGGTCTFNGVSAGTQLVGGVMASSIVIREVTT